MRRKDFWLLSTVNKVLKEFIPKLSHEADGLIFQVIEEDYWIMNLKSFRPPFFFFVGNVLSMGYLVPYIHQSLSFPVSDSISRRLMHLYS